MGKETIFVVFYRGRQRRTLGEMTSRSGQTPAVLELPRGSLSIELGGVVWFSCKHSGHRIALDGDDDDDDETSCDFDKTFSVKGVDFLQRPRD